MSPLKDNLVIYIFANDNLKMSPPKLAAQCAHAAVLAYDGSNEDLKNIYKNNNHYTKIILRAKNADHLNKIKEKLENHNLKTFLIIDEGRTELSGLNPTTLACEIVDRDDPKITKIFKRYQLLK